MFKVAIAFTLVAAIAADSPPAYGAPPPAYKPAPAYAPAPVYKEEAKPYSYQYGVADDYSGARFSANENSDAKVVTGSYSVHLPDGRVQTVTYTADHYNGYVADVKYEGTPVYPEAKPYHPAPAAYKPAPVYAPAPAYKPVPKYAPSYPAAPAAPAAAEEAAPAEEAAAPAEEAEA